MFKKLIRDYKENKEINEKYRRIKEKYDREFDADPSDLEDCYEQLDDIEDDLHNELFVNKGISEVLWLLEWRTISKVLEEKLVSIGSSLEAYNEWMETEEDDDLESEEENMNDKDSKISSNHHIKWGYRE